MSRNGKPRKHRPNARQVVKKSGLSQKEFAHKSGISYHTLNLHFRKNPENRISYLFWRLAIECAKKHPETFEKIVLPYGRKEDGSYKSPPTHKKKE